MKGFEKELIRLCSRHGLSMRHLRIQVRAVLFVIYILRGRL